MARRTSIFGLVMGLALMGPAPMSACAVWMPLSGGCAGATSADATAAAESPSQCDHMDMAPPSSDKELRASSDLPCCIAKNLPLPAQPKQAAPAVSAESARVAPPDLAMPAAPNAIEFSQNSKHSPPDLQPVLCVFLI